MITSGHESRTFRPLPSWILLGAAILTSAIAGAQTPAPAMGTPEVMPTRAPVILTTPALPAATDPITVATEVPVASTATSGAAAIVSPSDAVPATPAGRDATSLEPGADKSLMLPVFAGDPTTAIGNRAIFESLSPLRKAWFLREFYRNRGDAPRAETATETLFEVKLDSGLENVTGIAAALSAEARALQAEDKDAEAIAAAEAASRIAPDYTTAWTTLARVHLGARQIGPAFGGVEGAIRSTASNLRSKVRILGNAGLAALGGVFLCYGIFLLVAFIRHARFVAHDFRHALADNMPASLAAVILLPFLVFPLVFGVGPFVLLAWWSVVLWIMLTKRERIVVAVFLLLGAAMPVLLEKAAIPFAFEGGDSARLHAAIHEDELTARDFEQLEALAGETKDPAVLLTLGIAHQRAGRYPKARELYERARDAGAGGAAWIGLGDVHYALGEIPAAITAFEKALSAGDRSQLEAHFNLSQIYAERTDLAKSTAALEAAKRIDSERCERFIRQMLPPARKNIAAPQGGVIVAAAYVNRFLMVHPVEDGALLAQAAAGARSIATRTWADVSPAVPLRALTWIFGAALLVCGALTAAFHGAIPSRPCPRCGRSLCLRCDGPPLEEDLCTQCFHAFVQNEGVDPRARAAKEMEILRNHTRRHSRRKLFSFFIPGAGQVFAGETVRGVLLLLVACLAGVRAASWSGWFRPAYPLPGLFTPIAASTAALLVLILAWYLALRASRAAEKAGR